MSSDNFWSYDWENQQEWQSYIKNIEIPNSANENAMLTKLKAKWYKKNVDSTFDVNSIQQPGTSASAQPSKQSETASRQPQAKPQQNKQNASQSQTQKKSTLSTDSLGKQVLNTLLLRNTTLNLFILHCATLVLAAGVALPMLGYQRRCYRFYWFLSIGTYLYKITIKYGMPTKLWPLDHFKQWVSRPLSSTDFQYILLCVSMLTTWPMLPSLIPISTLALYHAVAFLSQQCAGNKLWDVSGRKFAQFLSKHQRNALMLNAYTEIGLLFYLILQLITPKRAPMAILSYWTFLRLRYLNSDASTYHAQVWREIERATSPLVRVVPGMGTGIRYLQQWFTQKG